MTLVVEAALPAVVRDRPAHEVAIRVLDILLAGAVLLVTFPLLMLLVILVRVTSPGDALFRQARVGRDLREFRLLKLRSMVADASARGPWHTDAGDPRITPMGRFLRRTSLDELPQLINVLAGSMSLVGPRPYVPAQAANYREAAWRLRHRVRPGVTGLAQVNGRSDLTPEASLGFDLCWAADPTLGEYLRSIAATVMVVVRGGGTT